MPRKAKAITDIRSTARIHTEMALRTLAGIAKHPKSPPAARVAAAQALLDRGWGKPSQPVTGKDEEPLQNKDMSALELAQAVGAIMRDAKKEPTP